jgi:plasmid stability protein
MRYGDGMDAKAKSRNVTLTVKNVSPELAQALKERATRHRRSLQGELTVILERAALGEEPLSVDEAFERIRRLGLKTRSESAAIVRELRDSR